MSRRTKVFIAAGLGLASVGLGVIWFRATNVTSAKGALINHYHLRQIDAGITSEHGHDLARFNAAVAQIAVFRTMLGAFRDDTGFYPTGGNGLQGLVRQPAGTTNWHGPYAQDIPKDPWGQEYVYEIPGKHASSGYLYDLFSLGPTPGTNIIANWAFPSLKP